MSPHTRWYKLKYVASIWTRSGEASKPHANTTKCFRFGPTLHQVVSTGPRCVRFFTEAPDCWESLLKNYSHLLNKKGLHKKNWQIYFRGRGPDYSENSIISRLSYKPHQSRDCSAAVFQECHAYTWDSLYLPESQLMCSWILKQLLQVHTLYWEVNTLKVLSISFHSSLPFRSSTLRDKLLHSISLSALYPLALLLGRGNHQYG